MSVITITDEVDVDVHVDLTADTIAVETTDPGGGTPGGGSDNYLVHSQATPAATWTIPHPLGRLPVVSIYLPTGEAVDTDVDADTGQAVITFPAPTAGWAVLV